MESSGPRHVRSRGISASARRERVHCSADDQDDDDDDEDDDKQFLGAWEMVMLSVATSLDAMAVGLTFAFLPINVWEASTMIGIITFGISLIGVYLGKFMGQFVGKYADIVGGGVLILIGTKILLQHLGIIGEF